MWSSPGRSPGWPSGTARKASCQAQLQKSLKCVCVWGGREGRAVAALIDAHFDFTSIFVTLKFKLNRSNKCADTWLLNPTQQEKTSGTVY